MAIAEIKVNCDSEELILWQIKGAWVKFVEETTNLQITSPYYSQQREKMVKAIRSAIPPDCYESLVVLPDNNDPFRRSKMDQAVDDVLFLMSDRFPQHSEVKELIRNKPYWSDFLEMKRG